MDNSPADIAYGWVGEVTVGMVMEKAADMPVDIPVDMPADMEDMVDMVGM